MQTENKLLDDLAKVASGAAGAAFGVRDEMRTRLRQEFERVVASLDLVTREEFEAVRAMAARARDEQESLHTRIETLEARLAGLETAAAPTPAKKGAAGRSRAAGGSGKAAGAKTAKSGTAKSSGPAESGHGS